MIEIYDLEMNDSISNKEVKILMRDKKEEKEIKVLKVQENYYEKVENDYVDNDEVIYFTIEIDVDKNSINTNFVNEDD